jgi:hypothetical protein
MIPTKNMRHFLILPFLALLTALPLGMGAQCEKPAQECMDDLVDFLSDGQAYKAQVTAGGTASFRVPLYEGFTYRVVACTNVPGAQIRYTVYDGSKKPVFSHVGSHSGAYWDFEIGASDNFTIKASLTKGAGCVVFGVGYDDEMNLSDDDLAEEDDPFYEDELSDEDYGIDD